MEKLKKFWQKNKILVVLVSILIACFIAICIVVATYFFGGSSSVYGDRLKDIDKHPITKQFQKDFVADLESEDIIDNVTISVKGRIVYIRIQYVADTVIEVAESKALASLDKFSKNILEYYDLNYTLVSEKTENSDGFTIMGAKNVSSNKDQIVWNQNTPVESEE